MASNNFTSRQWHLRQKIGVRKENCKLSPWKSQLKLPKGVTAIPQLRNSPTDDTPQLHLPQLILKLISNEKESTYKFSGTWKREPTLQKVHAKEEACWKIRACNKMEMLPVLELSVILIVPFPHLSSFLVRFLACPLISYLLDFHPVDFHPLDFHPLDFNPLEFPSLALHSLALHPLPLNPIAFHPRPYLLLTSCLHSTAVDESTGVKSGLSIEGLRVMPSAEKNWKPLLLMKEKFPTKFQESLSPAARRLLLPPFDLYFVPPWGAIRANAITSPHLASPLSPNFSPAHLFSSTNFSFVTKFSISILEFLVFFLHLLFYYLWFLTSSVLTSSFLTSSFFTSSFLTFSFLTSSYLISF